MQRGLIFRLFMLSLALFTYIRAVCSLIFIRIRDNMAFVPHLILNLSVLFCRCYFELFFLFCILLYCFVGIVNMRARKKRAVKLRIWISLKQNR